MKRIKLKHSLIVLSILFVSCNSTPPIKNTSVIADSIQSTTDTVNSTADTLLNQKDNKGRKQGIWKVFYKNGQLNSIANYVNDSIDGVYKSYFSDGKIQSRIDFKMGKKNGEYHLYYENGKTRAYGKMVLDSSLYFIKYDTSGTESIEEFYKNNKLYMSVSHHNGQTDTGRTINWK